MKTVAPAWHHSLWLAIRRNQEPTTANDQYRLTPFEETILLMFADGQSWRQIGRSFGLSKQRIYRIGQNAFAKLRRQFP